MRFPITRYSLLLLLALLLAACSKKPATTPESPLAQWLPDKGDLDGFIRDGNVRLCNRSNIWEHLGQNSDEFLYNGFEELAAATYVGEGQTRKLTIDIMRFSEPTRSFALYVHFRPPSAKSVDLPAEGYVAGDTLMLVKGHYLGRVMASEAGGEDDLIKLGKFVAARIVDSVMLPRQLRFFPAEGLIPQSETVTLDDIQGHNERSDLFGAKYFINGDTVALHFRLDPIGGPDVAITEFIGMKGAIKEYLLDSGSQSLIGQSGNGDLVYCAVREGVLAAVIGFSDKKVAVELVNRLIERITGTP